VEREKTRTLPIGMMRHQKNKGFTLFEILLVLALALMAISTMVLLWPKQDVTCARTLMSAFKLARFQAVSRKQPLEVLIDTKQRHLQVHDKTFTLPSAVILAGQRQQRIVFYPDGRNSGALLTCRSGQSALRLRLNALDGSVSIQRL